MTAPGSLLLHGLVEDNLAAASSDLLLAVVAEESQPSQQPPPARVAHPRRTVEFARLDIPTRVRELPPARTGSWSGSVGPSKLLSDWSPPAARSASPPEARETRRAPRDHTGVEVAGLRDGQAPGRASHSLPQPAAGRGPYAFV
jgi:hypothetical protein